MWKKLQRPRDSSLSATADKRASGVTGDSQSNVEQGHPGDTEPGRRPLPVTPMEPETSSEPRVASSIYSRPNTLIDTAGRQTSDPQQPVIRVSNHADVSPPVSPLSESKNRAEGSPDVSPIDEAPGKPHQFRQPERKHVESLPVPEKDVGHTTQGHTTQGNDEPSAVSRARPQVKNNPAPGSSGGTKWDDFSGEPTTNERGKAALASPGKLPRPTKSSAQKSSTQKSQFSILNKGRELNKAGRKFLENRRYYHDADDPAQTSPARVPWKGQSGRSAIVNPVQTKKSAQTQPVTRPPRKDSKAQSSQHPVKNSSQVPASRTKSQETVTPAVPPKDHVDKDTSPKAPAASVRTARQASSDRSPQLDDSKPLPTPRDDTTSVDEQAAENDKKHVGKESSKTRTASVQTARQTSTERIPQPNDSKPLPTPRDETTAEEKGAAENDEDFTPRLGDLNLGSQPGSRFSMSTFATTGSGSGPTSPKDPNADKDVPPLPSLPRGSISRAVPTAKVVPRKPTPSRVSNAKDLPRSPEEAEADNRIDALKARMNDLARRRGNIDTIIHELTQVIQPSSIAYDMATRGEVNNTVNSLNEELAEIKMEEHDVGIKLLRAYKKQDKEDYYGEKSVLWIKRVAS